MTKKDLLRRIIMIKQGDCLELMKELPDASVDVRWNGARCFEEDAR